MEITVTDCHNLPENCMVSVRFGATRRQAPLGTARSNPLKFPAALEDVREPLKIDVLQPIASARLVLHEFAESYHLGLDELGTVSPGSEVPLDGMSIALNVVPSSKDANANSDRKADSLFKFQDAAASAREYLEQHGLLRYVQALLHAVIQVKPNDPFAFMIQQLSAPKTAAKQTGNTTKVGDMAPAPPPKAVPELPEESMKPPSEPAKPPSDATPKPPPPRAPTEPSSEAGAAKSLPPREMGTSDADLPPGQPRTPDSEPAKPLAEPPADLGAAEGRAPFVPAPPKEPREPRAGRPSTARGAACRNVSLPPAPPPTPVQQAPMQLRSHRRASYGSDPGEQAALPASEATAEDPAAEAAAAEATPAQVPAAAADAEPTPAEQTKEPSVDAESTPPEQPEGGVGVDLDVEPGPSLKQVPEEPQATAASSGDRAPAPTSQPLQAKGGGRGDCGLEEWQVSPSESIATPRSQPSEHRAGDEMEPDADGFNSTARKASMESQVTVGPKPPGPSSRSRGGDPDKRLSLDSSRRRASSEPEQGDGRRASTGSCINPKCGSLDGHRASSEAQGQSPGDAPPPLPDGKPLPEAQAAPSERAEPGSEAKAALPAPAPEDATAAPMAIGVMPPVASAALPSETVEQAVGRLKRDLGAEQTVLIGICGSCDFKGANSQELTRLIGKQIFSQVPAGAKVNYVAGGKPGVQETLLREVEDATKVTSVVPYGQCSNFNHGSTLFGGIGVTDRNEIFSLIGDIYLLIEGGPGAVSEVQAAYLRGAIVVPVPRTGGAAAGMFALPPELLSKPDFITEAEWALLSDPTEALEEAAKAVASILVRLIDEEAESKGAQFFQAELRREATATLMEGSLDGRLASLLTEMSSNRGLDGHGQCTLEEPEPEAAGAAPKQQAEVDEAASEERTAEAIEVDKLVKVAMQTLTSAADDGRLQDALEAIRLLRLEAGGVVAPTPTCELAAMDLDEARKLAIDTLTKAVPGGRLQQALEAATSSRGEANAHGPAPFDLESPPMEETPLPDAAGVAPEPQSESAKASNTFDTARSERLASMRRSLGAAAKSGNLATMLEDLDRKGERADPPQAGDNEAPLTVDRMAAMRQAMLEAAKNGELEEILAAAGEKEAEGAKAAESQPAAPVSGADQASPAVDVEAVKAQLRNKLHMAESSGRLHTILGSVFSAHSQNLSSSNMQEHVREILAAAQVEAAPDGGEANVPIMKERVRSLLEQASTTGELTAALQEKMTAQPQPEPEGGKNEDDETPPCSLPTEEEMATIDMKGCVKSILVNAEKNGGLEAALEAAAPRIPSPPVEAEGPEKEEEEGIPTFTLSDEEQAMIETRGSMKSALVRAEESGELGNMLKATRPLPPAALPCEATSPAPAIGNVEELPNVQPSEEDTRGTANDSFSRTGETGEIVTILEGALKMQAPPTSAELAPDAPEEEEHENFEEVKQRIAQVLETAEATGELTRAVDAVIARKEGSAAEESRVRSPAPEPNDVEGPVQLPEEEPAPAPPIRPEGSPEPPSGEQAAMAVNAAKEVENPDEQPSNPLDVEELRMKLRQEFTGRVQSGELAQVLDNVLGKPAADAMPELPAEEGLPEEFVPEPVAKEAPPAGLAPDGHAAADETAAAAGAPAGSSGDAASVPEAAAPSSLPVAEKGPKDGPPVPPGKPASESGSSGPGRTEIVEMYGTVLSRVEAMNQDNRKLNNMVTTLAQDMETLKQSTALLRAKMEGDTQ